MDKESKAGRIRRSLIHLPSALFKKRKDGHSTFTLSLKASGILGLAGLAAVSYNLYQKNKEKEAEQALEDALPGEATPDSEMPVPEAIPEQPTLLGKIKKFFVGEEPKPAPSLKEGQVFESRLGPVLDKGYRSHQTFTGFSSSESLSKNGAYTEDEANTIRQLKAFNANTTANAGKMSTDIESRIRYFAHKHGFDENTALKMAQIESGGNPNAISATGAIGIYQFTGRTATEMGIQNRFNPDENIEAGILLAKRSVKALKSDELPETSTNIYLMHQLGVSGAKELIKAATANKPLSSLSVTTLKAVKLNYGGSTAKSAKEYIQLTEEALSKRSTSDKFASGSNVEVAPPVQSSVASATPIKVAATPVPATVPPQPIVLAKETPPSPSRGPSSQQAPSSAQPSPVPMVKPKPQALARTKEGLILDVS